MATGALSRRSAADAAADAAGCAGAGACALADACAVSVRPMDCEVIGLEFPVAVFFIGASRPECHFIGTFCYLNTRSGGECVTCWAARQRIASQLRGSIKYRRDGYDP